MGTVGIIAEYNPFHTGHAFQLAEAAKGADGVIVALSGDFVQRGEAAVFSKFARAEAAVRGGASLVLELPLPWCLASAEGFARGGVGLLHSTGLVDTLSFGSESADISRLTAAADALETETFREALRRELKSGASFASARQSAVSDIAGENIAAVLNDPNDLLAVEYIKASRTLGADMAFRSVLRKGTEHDGEGSASALRARLAKGEDIFSELPPSAAEVFKREIEAGRGPVTAESLRLPLVSRLRFLPAERFSALPDATEGIENRLREASRWELSPEYIASAAKSKRYALSRLRRMVLSAALDVEKGMADGTPPYIRVLAMDEKGKELLRRFSMFEAWMREEAAEQFQVFFEDYF